VTARSRWFRLLVALLALSLVAAACGGGDDDEEGGGGGTGGGDDTEAAVDENGVLRLGGVLNPNTSTTTYDLVKLPSPASDIHQLVFDTLLRAQLDGTMEPGLASGAEVVDPTTIEVTIREGLEFSDGSPLTPEDVQFSILRNRDSKNGGAFAAEMQEITDVTVEGQVVTIKLKSPVAGIFYQLLGRGETMVMSKKAVESGADQTSKPVSAGPYMIESLQVENKLVLKKNPNHFEADKVRIPTVELTHVSIQDPQALVNGLRSKDFDAAPVGGGQLLPEQVPTLEQAGMDVRTGVSPSTLLWGQLCKRDEPFSDIKVRQALNFALDREALNEVIYGGESEPMWGFWPSGHAFHNEELDGYYERDVAKAKRLLKEAGYEDGFTMPVANIAGITQTANELIKEQWAEIGVEVEIVPTNDIVKDFFTDNKMKMFFFPLQRSGLDKVTRNLVLGSIGNVCNWDDPRLNKLVTELRAVPQSGDSEEAVRLWHELEELTVTEAMNIFGVFGTTNNVWNPDRLGDVDFVPNFQGVPYLDVRNAYIKA
jgi:ABC-type transport system substrate-binding protein